MPVMSIKDMGFSPIDLHESEEHFFELGTSSVEILVKPPSASFFD